MVPTSPTSESPRPGSRGRADRVLALDTLHVNSVVPMMLMGLKITRANGLFLLAAYAVYVGYQLHLAAGA